MSHRYELNIARRVTSWSGEVRFEHFGRVDFGPLDAMEANVRSRLVAATFELAAPGGFKFDLTRWDESGRSVDFTA